MAPRGSSAPTDPHAPRPPRRAPRPEAVRPRPLREYAGPSLTRGEEHAHLVRVIASSPVYVDWLCRHNARLLEAEAARFTEHGQHAVAAVLRERAATHLAGTAGPWA